MSYNEQDTSVEDVKFCMKMEEDEFDNAEYIIEYVYSDSELDHPDAIAAEKLDQPTQLHSVQISSGEFENSVWSCLPGTEGSQIHKKRKIAQSKSGPLGLAKAAKNPPDCLSLFLDADVIATITEYTNEQIQVEKRNYARERDATDTDEVEIMALLGILYLASTVRDGRQNIDYLFESKKGTGMEAVYLTMSIHRFQFLMRCIQFDDQVNTLEATDTDKLAPIRAIFERIVSNFQKYFRPGQLLTLDEQLIQFKGACEFRQFISAPPSNAGFKFHLLADCAVPYTCNMEICVPSNHNPYNLSYAPADVVMRMTEPIQGKNKTVVLGPRYTSLETIKKLYDNRTMVIGEVKKSHKDIPKSFTVSKNRSAGDTMFAYHENVTLSSHVIRNKDPMILMSTHRQDTLIPEGDGEEEDPQKAKLDKIYNDSKNAVQYIQKMCSTYDAMRNSRRWPLRVFFNLMNLSAINAWCIYRLNHPDSELSRRDFQIDMALAWLHPQARRRMNYKTISRSLKLRIGMFLGLEKDEYDVAPVIPKSKGSRGRCYLCGRARNKTTRISCSSCGKFMCNDHCANLCQVCYNDTDSDNH